VGTDGVFLPVIVNDKAVEWLFDSAFSHAVLSESEARMLGVSVHGATGVGADFSGGTTTTRAAVADRMVIGDAELRNVPVLVVPDSQPPWNEQPPVSEERSAFPRHAV
jgi:predicted aspartyl protease